MGCPIVHFEICSKDKAASVAFYSELFGWTMKDEETSKDIGAYAQISTGSESGINGGIFQATDECPPYVAFYAHVDNLETYLDKAIALGGTKIMDRTPIGPMGFIAMFLDKDKHAVGLFEAAK